MRGSPTEQLETILGVMEAFLEKNSPREVAEILLRGMLRWTSSRTGFLGLVQNRYLRILSGGLLRGNALRPPPGAPASFLISASRILGRVLEQKDVLISQRAGREFPGDLLLGYAPPIRNFLLVPVHIGKEPLAVAFVANRRGGYSPGDPARVLLPARAFGLVLKTGREKDRQNVIEARLRLAQKMEAVGRLAGGIAHDFNNLLTTILGQCQALEDKLAGQETLMGELGEIREAGERAASLTRQLLAFGRKQPVQPRILNLNEILREMTRDLQALVGEGVEFQAILHPDLATVCADRSQMRQVLVDLVMNSRDAMGGRGALTIETSNVELDEAYVEEHPSTVTGPHVLMRIADTGSGIAPEVIDQVFEPFFTTKGRGKARGLGLATVYGVIKQSGGSISVDSQPGRGTTFRIYLPRQDGPAKATREVEVVGDPRGAERILLVEDDAMVRRLVRETLRSRGYKVVEASCAEDALRLIQSENPDVDLLLTDLVMPGLGGRELARIVVARWPDLPVLYMSGYSEELASRHGKLEPGASFLPKPFTIEELLLKVRLALRSMA